MTAEMQMYVRPKSDQCVELQVGRCIEKVPEESFGLRLETVIVSPPAYRSSCAKHTGVVLSSCPKSPNPAP